MVGRNYFFFLPASDIILLQRQILGEVFYQHHRAAEHKNIFVLG